MFTCIVAIGNNFAIGKDNKLLWHFPKDLKKFKEITSGNTIIMGRKTFQSLPSILPNRQHIVITRDKEFIVKDERVTIVHSTEELFASLEDSKEYFIIGGGKIYELLLPYCTKIHLTKINKDYDADTFFPKIDYSKWDITKEETGYIDNDKTIPYSFLTLDRFK